MLQRKSEYSQMLAQTLVAGLVAACGGKGTAPFVQHVQLRTFELDGTPYMSATALLSTYQLRIPAVTLPILNPGDPGRQYGTITLRPVPHGAELIIEADMKLITRAQPGTGRLPNGVQIPAYTGNAPVLMLPVGHSGSQIYLAFNESVALVGCAVVIREFDRLGRSIGNANLFPEFDFGNGVRGVAGIFTSFEANASGIAFFVDAASIINQANFVSGDVLALKYEARGRYRTGLTFFPQLPASWQKREIDSFLYRANRRRKSLTAQ